MQPYFDDLAVGAASDPDAFIQLYNACFSRVYNYIRFRCGDTQTAEDLTCHVFERLLLYISRYSPQKGPFESWLFAIVRNVVNDYYQRQRFSWLTWESLRRQTDPEPLPEEELVWHESLDELQAALLKLDSRSLDLVSLKFFARLSNRQIAAITHKSESAVGVALVRAVTRLRDWLSEEKMEMAQGKRAKELKDGRA